MLLLGVVASHQVEVGDDARRAEDDLGPVLRHIESLKLDALPDRVVRQAEVVLLERRLAVLRLFAGQDEHVAIGVDGTQTGRLGLHLAGDAVGEHDLAQAVELVALLADVLRHLFGVRATARGEDTEGRKSQDYDDDALQRVPFVEDRTSSDPLYSMGRYCQVLPGEQARPVAGAVVVPVSGAMPCVGSGSEHSGCEHDRDGGEGS